VETAVFLLFNVILVFIKYTTASMNKNHRADFKLFIAMIMFAGGLAAMGVMFLLIKNNQTRSMTASATDISAVPVEMDYSAPELELTTLDGAPVSLADFRGRVVLVNLWATWCPPCREEMPTLNSFYEQYKDQGFVLIAINQEESREVVEPFVEEFGLTFPVWLDEDYLAEDAFKTVHLPSSYVIGRDGNVRLMWIGAISEANLEKYIPDIILE
jgi:cytochrome c biogenesis protein CcmG/thiol:disulfide interchange protein DsbE